MPSQTQQLRQRFIISGAVLAVALIGLLYLVARARIGPLLERQAETHARAIATRSASVVTQYLAERLREAEALAAAPWVIRAARDAAQAAARRDLPRLDPPALERLLSPDRVLGGDPDLAAYLRRYHDHSDFVDVLVTEIHGYTVLASRRPADFVQSDEGWWRRAMADGSDEGEATYDASAGVTSMAYAVAIRPAPATRPVGVLQARFALDQLAALLAAEVSQAAALEVVDERGRLVITPDPSRLLQPIPEAGAVENQASSGLVGGELIVAAPAHDGRWRVLFRQPTAAAYAAARATERNIGAGLAGLFVALVALLWVATWWLNRLITEPVRAAGQIASRVASGDLSVTVVAHRTQTAEVGELLSSVHSMVVALRRLVGAIRSAADEAAAMASEISASTQQMSASTQEMAATTQDLTRRASEQSQLVRAGADDAGRILQIATILSGGADEAARRNTALSALARKHRELLDQSTAQLQQLAEEVHRGAAEAEALAQASAEIQKFVTQAKAVATQTNMLALNAAIEAARAGPQGRGFAVVADEVRKLAAQAAGAAGETADTVRGVLGRVQATRDRLVRLAASGAAAREAAQVASQALNRVAAEADANDAWSREIASSAGDVRRLVEEIAARLSSVAQGTDSLVASAEELAASSEEQSASTEEIASSANQLAEAAEKLTGAIKSFRLFADDEPATRQAAD